MARGTQIHLLLEHLPNAPRASWADIAQELLAETGGTQAEREALFREAETVLTSPALLPLFAPSALAEVDVTAYLPQIDRQMVGTIDRLIVTASDVLAVDFKTNAAVPDRPEDTPDGILRQMGAYQVALDQIYPDRMVSTAILWTRTATRMDLPPALVRAALGNAVVNPGDA